MKVEFVRNSDGAASKSRISRTNGKIYEGKLSVFRNKNTGAQGFDEGNIPRAQNHKRAV